MSVFIAAPTETVFFHPTKPIEIEKDNTMFQKLALLTILFSLSLVSNNTVSAQENCITAELQAEITALDLPSHHVPELFYQSEPCDQLVFVVNDTNEQSDPYDIVAIKEDELWNLKQINLDFKHTRIMGIQVIDSQPEIYLFYGNLVFAKLSFAFDGTYDYMLESVLEENIPEEILNLEQNRFECVGSLGAFAEYRHIFQQIDWSSLEIEIQHFECTGIAIFKDADNQWIITFHEGLPFGYAIHDYYGDTILVSVEVTYSEVRYQIRNSENPDGCSIFVAGLLEQRASNQSCN